MKTAIYIRVSTQEQAKEGYSIPHQKERLFRYCEAMNWEITEIYADEGISGSTIEKRPAATQMLQDAKHKKFENILILRVDRLCRNTKDLLEIVEILKKYDVSLNAVDQQIDYKTSIGKMTLTILGTFAEFEHSTIHERTMEGRKQKATQGIKSLGRRVPFGYDYINGNFVANSDAQIVKLIFEKVADGYGYNQVATFLRKNNVPTIDKLDWNRLHIKRIINNKIYMGHCVLKLKMVEVVDTVATNVESIVNEDLFKQAQKTISYRTNGKTTKYAYDDFIFADVLYCACCGWKMSPKKVKRAEPKVNEIKLEDRYYRYYKCIYNMCHPNKQTCKNTKVLNAEKFEKHFLIYMDYYVIELKKPIKNNKKISTSSMNKETIEIQIKELTQKKAKLLDRYLEGIIDDDSYFAKNNELIEQIKILETKLSFNEELLKIEKKEINLDYLNGLKFIITDLWSIMTNHEKRNFITKTFEKIEVNQGKIVKIILR